MKSHATGRSLLLPAALTLALAGMTGCSKQPEQQAAAPAAETGAQAPQQVADLKLGTSQQDSATITDVKDAFNPGEPIQLSMAVNGAPSGTAVTTYWYGPANQELGYETLIVNQGDDRIRFVLDNTRDLSAGQYHAEVWVGNQKVDERTFQVAQS